jgi:putative hemolysin
LDFREKRGNGDYNTVAGMILDKLGRIPQIGEKLDWNEYEIEIVDLDGLRIDKLIIKKKYEE